MKTIVITGSTRGIGRGLAENFLERDCKVAITGRSQDSVDAVVAELGVKYGADRVTGKACNIASYEELLALWHHVKTEFKQIDVWINNAGMSIERLPVFDADVGDLKAIVETNLTGMLLCAKVVMTGMKEQGNGQIWNMEGFGSTGMTQRGMAPYGATKRAVNYLNKALQKDAEGTGVQICTLSPGIVVTDLLVGDYDLKSEEWQKVKKSLNILGDTVETVTPYLVEGVLAADKNGAKVEWLTGPKVLKKFLLSRFRKREDLFTEYEAKANS